MLKTLCLLSCALYENIWDSIFREKSPDVSKKKARDPLVGVFLEFLYASVNLWQVWWS